MKLTEVYLEHSQASMMEFFAKIVNGLWLLTIFAKIMSIVDVRLGFKYTSGSLGAPYGMTPLNSFLLRYLRQNHFVFCFQK